MKKKNRNQVDTSGYDDSGSDEINTVYGDMVTFIMMLFILLFVLSYNKQQNEDFFTQMSIKFGGKQNESKSSITTDSLLVSSLKNFIKKERLDETAQVLVDEQKVTLVLSTPILFDSGKADLKSPSYAMLDKVANILAGVDNPVIIEGHTDNMPINTEEFSSNWELSFYRAFSVVKHLIDKKGFSPKQLSAIGYGEHHPIEDNATREGRGKNRRIEVNIIRITKK